MRLRNVEQVIAFRDLELVFDAFLVYECDVQSVTDVSKKNRGILHS
jgi:hypothetical protein